MEPKTEPRLFFELADVVRRTGRMPGRVRELIASGHLRVAALTPRGLRLFVPEDVERLAQTLPRRATVEARRQVHRSRRRLEPYKPAPSPEPDAADGNADAT